MSLPAVSAGFQSRTAQWIGGSADAVRAAEAATAAFDSWSTTPVAQRRLLLSRVVAGLEAKAELFAEVLTAEVGAPVRVARAAQGLASAWPTWGQRCSTGTASRSGSGTPW
jgi:acyl-CoA reductase-like NAD-dependent aldehyde dehydrogenase